VSGVSFKQVISFGSYRLDPASGRFLHRSTPVPLRLKAFAVLEYLAMRPGRLVSKEALLHALWPEPTSRRRFLPVASASSGDRSTTLGPRASSRPCAWRTRRLRRLQAPERMPVGHNYA